MAMVLKFVANKCPWTIVRKLYIIKVYNIIFPLIWKNAAPNSYRGHLSIQNTQVYIAKRRTLIQVLPPANAYTKFAHAYIYFAIFFCYLLMHVFIFIAIRPVCVHGVRIGCLIAILRANAYMHEQIT